MEEAQSNSNKEQTAGKPTDKQVPIIYKRMMIVMTDSEDLKTRWKWNPGLWGHEEGMDEMLVRSLFWGEKGCGRECWLPLNIPSLFLLTDTNPDSKEEHCYPAKQLHALPPLQLVWPMLCEHILCANVLKRRANFSTALSHCCWLALKCPLGW